MLNIIMRETHVRTTMRSHAHLDGHCDQKGEGEGEEKEEKKKKKRICKVRSFE